MTSPGWTLQSGTRRFGPMSEDEMRAYFRAGMVKGNDLVHAPDREAPLSASEAAAELGMPAPPPQPVAPTPYEPPRKPAVIAGVAANGSSVASVASAPATPAIPAASVPPPNVPLVPPAPTAGFKVTERGPDARWPIVLWIAVLFGLHLVLAPQIFPARAASMNGFALISFVACALVAAAVFFGFSRLATALRTRPPRVTVALAALTLAYLGFGARHLFIDSTLDPSGQRVELRAGIMAWDNRAAALHDKQDWPALVELCNRWLREREGHYLALSWRGIAYHEMDRFTEATRDFEKVVALKPKDHWGWTELGDSRYFGGDYPGAIEAYHRSLELKPGNKQAWLNIGNAHYNLQHLDEQVVAYERAIEIDPNYGVAWSNLAYAYGKQGRQAKADEARARAEALGK